MTQQKLRERESADVKEATPIVRNERNMEDTMPRNLAINLSPRKKEDHQYSSFQEDNSAVSMNFAALIENENKIKTQIPTIKPVSAIFNPLIKH